MDSLTQKSNTNHYVAFIAIDWANEEHQLCLQEQGTTRRHYEVLKQCPNMINRWALGMLERFNGGRIAIAIEQTKGPLIYALMHYDFIDIYPINPSTLGNYRQAFRPSGAKSDIIDVDYLMDILLMHRAQLRLWKPDSEQTRKLDIYCRQRRQLVNSSVGLCHRYRALLKSYYPQALQMIGEDLSSKMAIDFLTKWPSFQKLLRAREATLIEFYHKHRSRSKTLIKKRLQLVRNSKALTQDNAIIETSELILTQELSHLKVIKSSIATYDKEIMQLFKAHPDASLYEALPGAGDALAPRLLVALGSDRERFKNALELQAFSGIAPIVRESGTDKNTAKTSKQKFKGSKVTIRRHRCPKFLLQSFHEFAKCSINQSIWARAYYEQQKAKGKGNNEAIRALAYKWIRIIFACWQKHQIYDEQQYMLSLKKRDSKLLTLIAKQAA